MWWRREFCGGHASTRDVCHSLFGDTRLAYELYEAAKAGASRLGIQIIRTRGEEREIDKFAKVSKKLADVSASNEKFWAVSFPLVGNFMALGEFLVLIIGGKMVLDGTLTLGELTRFNLYLAYLYAPLRWLSMFPRRLADCTTSLVKIYEILDDEANSEVCDSDVKIDASQSIDFENVSFKYNATAKKFALNNINLHIQSGMKM